MPGTAAPAQGVVGLGALGALPAGVPQGSTCRVATCLSGDPATLGVLQPGRLLQAFCDSDPCHLSASRT